MKLNAVITLIVSCLFISCSSKILSGGSDADRYTRAFKYISKHDKFLKNSNINSFDSLETIDLSPFSSELQNDWGLKQSTTLLLTDSIGKNSPRQLYKPWLKNLFTKASNQKSFFVYFSQPYKNYITAEIFDANLIKGATPGNNEPMFGQSRRYLIVFDDTNNVVKTYLKEIAYN